MENKNYFTIGALVLAVLVLGVIGFTVRKPVVNVNPVTHTTEFGGMPGPDIRSPYLSVNGLKTWPYTGTCNNATTTLFNLISPNATSTIDFAKIWGTNGTTTSDIIVGTSTLGSIAASSTIWGPAGFIVRLSNTTGSVTFCGTMGSVVGECPAGVSTTKTQITIPPLTHILGYAVSGTASTITSASNTFSCQYEIRITE